MIVLMSLRMVWMMLWHFFWLVGDLSVVTLSKTKRKGREHKEAVVNTIKQAAEDYNSVYVFSFENMRNLKFKEFRDQLKTTSRQVWFSCCRICFTGNSVHLWNLRVKIKLRCWSLVPCLLFDAEVDFANLGC